MQKLVTTVALILVCFAATSATYYYGKYLPRLHDAELAEQRRKTDLENAQRCNKDATKFYGDFHKDLSSDRLGPNWNWYHPEMHFSRKLNTCLVELSWHDFISGAQFVTKQVNDIYSNREIISTYFTFENGKEKPLDPNLSRMEPKKYSAEKDKLFSE
jgi:hypothetical protein